MSQQTNNKGNPMGKQEKQAAKIAAAVAAALAASGANASQVEVKETSSESLSVSGKSGTLSI